MTKTREAQGFSSNGCTIKIAVTIPRNLFLELKAQAIRQGRSISAQIGDYIQVGVAVDRDWDLDVGREPFVIDVSKAPTLAKTVENWTIDEFGNPTRIIRSDR